MNAGKKDKPAGTPETLTQYCVPSSPASAEFTEKRSRFIARVWPVEDEKEAKARIAETKAEHHDARHNCWCYILRRGGVVRYSDDGEPQGTAGQPMLEVFRRERVENVCCVVTRYFGGILLGTGGLTRAYARAAAAGLEAAGTGIVRRWLRISADCPYHLFERVKLALDAAGGISEKVEYAEKIGLTMLLPESQTQAFCTQIGELAAGGVVPRVTGEVFRAHPKNKNE